MRGGGRLVALWSVVALGSGGGCSASSSGCDGGCWRPTQADQDFIASFCALSEACCVANALRSRTDLPDCEGAIDYLGASGDPALQASCLAEMQSLSGSLDCLPELGNLSDPCMRVFDERSGPQGPGQPCVKNGDCAGPPGTIAVCSPDPHSPDRSRDFCLLLTPGAAGDHTCLGNVTVEGVVDVAAVYPAVSGAPPITTGFVCEQSKGLYCLPSSDPTGSACTPFAAAGATCDDNTVECASGLCLSANGQPSTCASTAAIGQPCLPGSMPCDETSYCNYDGTSLGTCVAKGDTGAACSTGDTCASANCVNTGCSAQSYAEHFAVFSICQLGV
jgi:hypothetical protein